MTEKIKEAKKTTKKVIAPKETAKKVTTPKEIVKDTPKKFVTTKAVVKETPKEIKKEVTKEVIKEVKEAPAKIATPKEVVVATPVIKEVSKEEADKITFEELGLSSKTLEGLQKKGFKHPSPIQAAVIPLLLAGKKNIIGQAATGTGKTAAFGIPMVEKLDRDSNHIQALILVPTRELAIQVAEEISSFQSRRDLDVVAIYGGQSYEIQNRALKKGVDIVVGTPGRVMDHLDRRTLKVEQIKYFVLDEADEMLNMGFIDDIETIFRQTNPDKKVLLFSATMPREILSVAKKYMGEYELIAIKKDQLATAQTEQFFVQITERDKLEALCRIMDKEEDFYGIVFCKTKMDVDHVYQRLHEKGYSAHALHGDVQQKQREVILKLFKSKKVKILIATDVAARGIDVNDITHVINFALPQDAESYVHRIGRTGRAGKKGIAITFITSSEFKKFSYFQKATNSDVKKMDIPTVSNVIDAKKKKLKTSVETILEKGSHEKYLHLAQELITDKEADHVIAALLRMAYANEFNEENYTLIEKVSINTAPRGAGGSSNARLFIALGKKAGYYPKTLVEFITEATGIPSREIDDVRVMEDFSFITVPEGQSEIVIRTLKGTASRAKGTPNDGSSAGGRPYGDRGGYNRDNNRGWYAGGNDRGGYNRDNNRGWYAGGNDRGGYNRDNNRGWYAGGNDRGGYNRDNNRPSDRGSSFPRDNNERKSYRYKLTK